MFNISGKKSRYLTLSAILIISFGCNTPNTVAPVTDLTSMQAPDLTDASDAAPPLSVIPEVVPTFTLTPEPIPTFTLTPLPNGSLVISKAREYCNQVFSSPGNNVYDQENLFKPFYLVMFNSELNNDGWKPISVNPKFETTSVDEIGTVFCINESADRYLEYEDGTVGYRVKWNILLVDWSTGKVQQTGGAYADPPNPKVGDGDRYGTPDAAEFFEKYGYFGYLYTQQPIKSDGVVIASIAFSGDGQILTIEDAKGGVTSIDLVSAETLQSVRDELLPVNSYSEVVTAVSPDGSFTASSNDDFSIAVRDNKSSQQLPSLSKHLGRITALTFSPQGDVLASGSVDGRVILWNVKTGEMLRYFFVKYIPVVTTDYKLPSLEFIDVDGNPVSSSEFEDKVVLYYLWSGYCFDCEEEIKTLEAYYSTYKGSGFMVVGVVVGSGLLAGENDLVATTQEQARTTSENFGLTFPSLLYADYESEASLHSDYSSPPQFYLVDRTGVVRLRWGNDSEEFWKSFVTFEFLEKYVTPFIMEK